MPAEMPRRQGAPARPPVYAPSGMRLDETDLKLLRVLRRSPRLHRNPQSIEHSSSAPECDFRRTDKNSEKDEFDRVPASGVARHWPDGIGQAELISSPVPQAS